MSNGMAWVLTGQVVTLAMLLLTPEGLQGGHQAAQRDILKRTGRAMMPMTPYWAIMLLWMIWPIVIVVMVIKLFCGDEKFPPSS